MKTIARFLCVLGLMITGMLVAAPASQATPSILVGQCSEFATCYSSQTVTPWSYDLTAAQLASLGDSTSLIVGQTAQYIIRLGVTTITFTTPGGPVVDTLPELNGNGSFNGPCVACYFEVDTVGTFAIPDEASLATISGTFGNSQVPNSAAVCLFLGSLGSCGDGDTTFHPPSGVPEPITLSVFGVGLVGAAAARRRKRARV
jgi:hypothetical protein